MNKDFIKGEFNAVQVIKLTMMAIAGLWALIQLWRVGNLLEAILEKL